MKQKQSITLSLIAPEGTPSYSPLQDFSQTLKEIQDLWQTVTLIQEGLLTSAAKHRRLKMRAIPYDKPGEPFHCIPSLTLRGDWVEKAGFSPGEHVRVITLHRLLVICPDDLLPYEAA